MLKHGDLLHFGNVQGVAASLLPRSLYKESLKKRMLS